MDPTIEEAMGAHILKLQNVAKAKQVILQTSLSSQIYD